LSSSLTLSAMILLAFWTVLVAELVGDKSMYTLTSLTLRFRAGLVFAAFALASGAKMLVAVVLGSAVLRFQSHWTYAVSAIAFFISAILIWTEGREPAQEAQSGSAAWGKGALACFASFFLTEWADPGQIAAAALVLKSHLLWATWIGGTLAIMTKGAVAMSLGVQIRNRFSQRTLRVLATVSCCILGIMALTEIVLANS
jgi:putative Ca2+/H+ antiporter (TMEM165/GDT1 family)